MRFVDTNLLLYAISRSPAELRKQRVAADILSGRDVAISVQVLQEFYVQATRSTRDDALSPRQASELVRSFSRFPVHPTNMHLVEAAIATSQRFGLSYWDAAILEAARALGCTEVLSEDLSHGQEYDGVRVTNPFR